MPNLLIVGTNRIETYERSIERAFSKLGWTVDFWDPALELARVSRGKRPGRLLTSLIRIEPWLQKANLRLIQLVDRLGPDLILVIGTTGVRAGSLAQIRVRCPKTVIYCLYPDSPHNLDLDRIQCIPFLTVLPLHLLLGFPLFVNSGRSGSAICHLLLIQSTFDRLPTERKHCRRTKLALWVIGDRSGRLC